MKRFLVLCLCFSILSPCATFAKNQKAEKAPSEKQLEKQREKEEKARAKKEAQEAKKIESELKAKKWAVVPATQDGPQKMMIKKGGENVNVIKDIVKLQTFSQNGSLAMFIAGKKDAWLPIYEVTDLAESTYISLFVDGSEYRLNRSKKVQSYFVFDDSSVEAHYVIENLAHLKAAYVIQGQNVLVSYMIENLDAKRHSFSVKAVFNTFLGENFNFHFTLSTNTNVFDEVIFTPSSKLNSFSSSDGKCRADFILFGDSITPPKFVVLANKNIIEDSSVNTIFKRGRSFNSVLAYNNSSAGLYWDYYYLPPQESKSYSYRIKLSNYDLKNVVHDNEDFFVPEPEPVPVVEPTPIDENAYAPIELPPEVLPEVEETQEPEYIDKVDEASNKLHYDFNTERNYLDPSINEEYVRRLIEEIDSLERTDPALNREKIHELQKEIDEVLRILRSRK